MSNTLKSLMRRFKYYSDDQAFYEEIINQLKDDNDYNKAINLVIGAVRADWSNQKIDWFINYINDNICDGLTPDNNLDILYDLVLFAARYGVRINYEILAILLEECPVLNDILVSIFMDYPDTLDKADIIKIGSKYDYRLDVLNVLIYYAILTGRMVSDDLKYQTYIPYPIKTVMANRRTKISSSEERELLTKAKNGDLKACDTLIYNNILFILQIAKKYWDGQVSIYDLISEGVIGLIEAIDNFDLDSDNNLLTFAKYYITRYIRSYSVKAMGCCTTSTYIEHRTWQVIRTKEALEKRKGIDPTIEDIAQIAEIPLKWLSKINEHITPAYSLEDVPLDNNNSWDDGEIVNQIILKEIAEVVQLLPEAKRECFEMVIHGESYADIGRRNGKSRQCIMEEYHSICATIKALMCLKGYHEEILGKCEEHPRYLDYMDEKTIVSINRSLKLTPEIISLHLNQEIDPEVWWAYKCGAINEVTLGCFAFVSITEAPIYLRQILTSQISFIDFKRIVRTKVNTDVTFLVDDLHKLLKSAKMN